VAGRRPVSDSGPPRPQGLSTDSTRTPLWQNLSKGLGFLIVVALFVLFCASTVDPHIRVDTPLALAFLTIASALIGIPAAYRIGIFRNGSSNGGP
jgi:hypothetical protein